MGTELCSGDAVKASLTVVSLLLPESCAACKPSHLLQCLSRCGAHELTNAAFAEIASLIVKWYSQLRPISIHACQWAVSRGKHESMFRGLTLGIVVLSLWARDAPRWNGKTPLLFRKGLPFEHINLQWNFIAVKIS
jgi:hypothetical protein